MKLTKFAGAALALAASSAAAAQSTEPEREAEGESWPAEFAGRTFQIVTPSGMTNWVSLEARGTLTALPRHGSAGAVDGTWTSKDGALCTRFVPRGEECWDPAAVVAAHGEVVTVRSHRGQALKIRLLNGAEEQPGAAD
jgi:hypothetical protein